jgi:hypothetical protein
MPAEIVFSNGGSVKVTASAEEFATALEAGSGVVDTNRFAGFRGDEAVGAERVVVSVAAVAYVQEVRGP